MLAMYYTKELVEKIVYFIAFFSIMKKIGFKYESKSLLLKIIILALIVFSITFKISYKLVPFLRMLVIIFTCISGYKLNLKKSLIYSLTYTLASIIFKYIIHFTILYLWICIPNKSPLANYTDLVEMIISNLLILILIYNLDKFRNMYLNKKYYIYIALTIIVNLLIILFIDMSSKGIYEMYELITNNKLNHGLNKEFFPLVNFADFTLSYIIVGINLIFISVFINSIKTAREDAKREVMNEKLGLQYNYYMTMKESQEKIRELYHDINNHMNNIKALKKNSYEVDKYVDSIDNKINEIKNIYNSGSLLLDTILNEKGKICKSEEIEFICGINFSKCDFIDMLDVTSIFSNLLDNAVEACKKINNERCNKYINIRGTFYKTYYVIRCENSKINEIKMHHKKIITSKKDKFVHGIGIQSIKSSIKKYNGELDIKTEEDKFIASIYIPIKIKA